jgi:formyltetrahydrofolate synthetase
VGQLILKNSYMILFITGALCVGMAYTMFTTARLLSRISKLEENLQDVREGIQNVHRDVNMVEHTIMNRINIVDQSHTQAEDEIRQVISGSMKSSNKRLLKG